MRTTPSAAHSDALQQVPPAAAHSDPASLPPPPLGLLRTPYYFYIKK